MKIALDVVTLMQPKTGIGIYTFHLLSEFIKSAPENDYLPFDLLWKQPIDHVIRGSKDLSRLFERLHHLSTIPFPFQQVVRKGLCSYADRFGGSFKWKEIDLFFGPCFKGVFKKDFKTVITIHDLAHELYPEMAPTHFFHYLKRKLPEEVRKASLLIAVSQNTKKDLMEFLNVPDEKIKVIYHGVDKSFRPVRDQDVLEQIRKKYRLPERFILYVGAIQPRKNIAGLIQAYHRLVQKPDFKPFLVIAGGVGWKNGEIHRLVKEHDLEERIIFTGYIEPSDLPLIYNLSEVFVFPSFYEGFGLPVLEAMACGIPVVTSNISALPEVAEDAAYLIDPHSLDEIAEGIFRLLSDEELRSHYIKKGLERIRPFTWERCAAETLKVFQDIL